MRQATIVVAALLLLAAGGALAGERAERRVEADDEVVREVVRMLEGSVPQAVIRRWLERERRHPASLSPNDLIALTRAEASPELMEQLLGSPRTTVPPPPAKSEPAAGASRARCGGAVPVAFSIRYRPYRDPEADEDQQWHLFVYMDGRPLGWSDGKSWLSRSKRNRDLSVDVSPGRHVLRLVQERHERRGKGWHHEARACPDAIVFEAVPGEPRVEIELREPSGLGFGKRSTFRWALWDGGRVVDESALPGPPERWAPLCEEIESNHAQGRKVPRRVRRQLERCVRWADLWSGVAGAPDRAAVRSELERYDFRPVVASD